MEKFARQRRILEIAALEGGVSVTALAESLGTSRMTIRRDLEELSREGKVRRGHGGASALDLGAIKFEFVQRQYAHGPEKQAIARAVAGMVRPGMAVSLDTGTTTLEVARAIRSQRGLTVLTSSLAIASVLYSEGRDLDLVLLGGQARRTSPDLTGPLTEENLRRFRVHLAVVGADAVTEDGTFATDEGVCRICRAMAHNADRVVVVADSSKFARTAFAQCLALSDIDVLVTDEGCPEEMRSWLDRAVKQVVYARVLQPFPREPAGQAGEPGPAEEPADER